MKSSSLCVCVCDSFAPAIARSLPHCILFMPHIYIEYLICIQLRIIFKYPMVE